MICNKCGKPINEMFTTVVDIDYVDIGKAKPHRYHLCMNCKTINRMDKQMVKCKLIMRGKPEQTCTKEKCIFWINEKCQPQVFK